MFSVQFACILILISLTEWETDLFKILGIFALPSRSHFQVGETLLKEMARRGHSVDVISHFPQNEKINNYNDISLVGSTPIFVNNVTFEESQRYSLSEIHFFVADVGFKVCDLLGHSSFQKLMKTPKGTYDVIIIESFAAPCYIAFGQQLSAPVIGLVASKMLDWFYEPFGIPLNPTYVPSFFPISSPHMTFWERLKNTLIIHAVNYQMNYYLSYEIEQVETYFNRKLSSLNELYNDVSLVLVNEHFTINGIKPLPPNVIEIGGLHVHDSGETLSPDLQKWLDESIEGCVYMTFGSMVNIETMPRKLLNIFYEAFERIAPTRVLLKVLEASSLPDGLPKNVRTSSWLPQITILKHNNTKAFITHGGLLSTEEAVAYKVPMIGIPLFSDQPSLMQNYVDHKIAIALSIDALTADSLTDAVNSALNDPIYRENINKISNRYFDRPMSAMETAIYWVQYTVRHGNVIKSPATQLTWWQLNSLDIYGFITISCLIIIFIMKRLLKFFWNFVKRNSSKKYTVIKNE